MKKTVVWLTLFIGCMLLASVVARVSLFGFDHQRLLCYNNKGESTIWVIKNVQPRDYYSNMMKGDNGSGYLMYVAAPVVWAEFMILRRSYEFDDPVVSKFGGELRRKSGLDYDTAIKLDYTDWIFTKDGHPVK